MPALQQTGSGNIRALVIWYYAGSTELLETLDPSVCVISSGASGKFHYINPENPTLTDIKKKYGEQLDCEFGTTMLVGFSAGCQGVRQQLLEGENPHGILVCDGVHSSNPPQEWQLKVWREYLATCGASFPEVPFGSWDGFFPNNFIRWTTSDIQPPDYAGTLETLNRVTGLELVPGASLTNPTSVISNNATLLCYPGKTADDHIYQATKILPIQHAELAEELGIGKSGYQPQPPVKPRVPTPEPAIPTPQKPGEPTPPENIAKANPLALGLIAALVVFLIAQEL